MSSEPMLRVFDYGLRNIIKFVKDELLEGLLTSCSANLKDDVAKLLICFRP